MSGFEHILPFHGVDQAGNEEKENNVNTNNAPERYTPKHTQLPQGWKLIRREDGEDIIHHPTAGIVGRMSFGDDFAADMNAAMQPQVSESDESVREALEELLEAERLNMYEVAPTCDRITTRLVDARNAAHQALAKHRQPATVSADAELIQLLFDIQAWGLAEGDGSFSHMHWKKQLHERIRKASALSPETVCGGER